MTSDPAREQQPTQRLKHVLSNLVSGGTPESDNDLYWASDGEGIPWVTIADMTRQQVIVDTDRRLTPAGLASKRLAILPKGTLLYSIYASLGRTAVLGVSAATNQAILALIPKSDVLEGGFLRWWLEHKRASMLQQASTNTQDNLSAEEIRNIEIHVPPIPRQRTIADFLDRETARIDALIAKKERLLELLEEKRTALITRAVTKGLDPAVPMKESDVEWLGRVPAHWGIKRLKYVVPEITVGIVVTPAKYYVDEGVPCLRSFNISSGGIDLSDIAYISRESNNLHAKSIIREGDVLVVRTGLAGAAVVVPEELAGANCIDLLIIRRSTRVLPEFLQNFLSSTAAATQVEINTEGAIQGHYNTSTLANLLLAIPPVPEQHMIVNHLAAETSQLSVLRDRVKDAIALLREYRTALISAAVTGQFDVTRKIETVRAVQPTT